MWRVGPLRARWPRNANVGNALYNEFEIQVLHKVLEQEKYRQNVLKRLFGRKTDRSTDANNDFVIFQNVI